MKPVCCLALLALTFPALGQERTSNLVILDETGVRNLGIELAPVRETSFEKTVFAIGRLEEDPSLHAIVSSRIAGRVAEVEAFPGELVEPGQPLLAIESRQAGNPPPVIRLEAPQSGLVLTSAAHVGEPVEPDRELMDILDIRKLWAVARVPEHEIAPLEPGITKARIRVPALGSETRLEGTLLRLGTVADRQGGTLDAIFEIENPDLKLRPGMRAEFAIVVERRSHVMAVPREALQGDPARRIVYVKDFELPNAFLETPVETGAVNDAMVEIRSGLFPGDEVVSRGAYFLGFAGSGTVSLKEALDAAHGHEHNEDGTELTAEQRAARVAERSGGSTGTGPGGALTLFLGLLSGVLLLLLVLSLGRRKTRAGSVDA